MKNVTIKTRQMTLGGKVTNEGFVITQDGLTVFSGINRNRKSEAKKDAKEIAETL